MIAGAIALTVLTWALVVLSTRMRWLPRWFSIWFVALPMQWAAYWMVCQ